MKGVKLFPANVLRLPQAKNRRHRIAPLAAGRFKIIPYENRNGSKSWRVTGSKRDGARIRENFIDEKSARCRWSALENEYLAQHSDTAIRATKLTAEQLKLAEVAFIKLGDDWQHILNAVEHWKQHGKQRMVVESPRVDDAVTQYQVWLEASPFRDATKRHWKFRMNVFKNTVPNHRIADFTPTEIENFLSTQKPGSRDTYRRAVSRFFSWCIERPRHWTTANPCREVKVHRVESDAPPAILSIEECEALLRAAMQHKGGLLVPYTAACLFAGLRPFEAARIDWPQVNLTDRELRLESNQTKTGRKSKRGRVVTIHKTLAAWLQAYRSQPFYPPNWRKEFNIVKRAAGFGVDLKPWPSDVMRHTAISHYFRDSGSYGLTAEQFGNSESVIKTHYQARVSSDDTKRFYAMAPKGVSK